MKLKVGQKVIIKKHFGTGPGNEASNSRDKYYYGTRLRDVPLGSRGVIVRPCGSHYQIMVGDSIYCFTNGEYAIDDQISNEQGQRVSSLLEVSLLDQTSVAGAGTDDGRHKFDPKFNVREEFAVWIRQEFPELKRYAKKKKVYESLAERKAEVIESARVAYEHAIKTAQGCARTGFEVSFARLSGNKGKLVFYVGSALDMQHGWVKTFSLTSEDKKTSRDKPELFPRNLEEFVQCIERSALNLSSSNGRHYGTQVVGV